MNWTFDFKKIRILKYLLANGEGAIRSHFLNLKRERPFGIISSSEIDTILYELILDELITQEVQRSTGNKVYKISENGSRLISTLIEFEREYSDCKLYVLDALREPTDQVISRNSTLSGSQER